MKKIRISPPVAPSKPIKPLEEQFMSSILLRQENEFSMTLEELMNEIPEEAKLSELSIEVDRDYDAYGGDFDTIYFYLRWERMEKTIGYEEILSLYEKEMKEYKEEIKKYRKSKKEYDKIMLAQNKERLEKELETIKEKLSKVNKKIDSKG